MNLETLKAKLDEKELATLTEHIDAITAQRDAARKESIDGRKALKAKVDELTAAQTRVLEKLGIDSLDELDSLPDAKGQADAVKQFDVKLKRMERELADAHKARDEIAAKHRDALTGAALEKALSAHEWIDRDIALLLAKQGVQVEGDEILFTAEGKAVPLAEGVKWLAQTKPHLLKSAGAGGSGHTGNAGSANGGNNPWSKDTHNLTAQIALDRDNPTLAAQLKAQAGVAAVTQPAPITLI